MDNFERHLTSYRSKNANPVAISAGFDDSFLAWLLASDQVMGVRRIYKVHYSNLIRMAEYYRPK